MLNFTVTAERAPRLHRCVSGAEGALGEKRWPPPNLAARAVFINTCSPLAAHSAHVTVHVCLNAIGRFAQGKEISEFLKRA